MSGPPSHYLFLVQHLLLKLLYELTLLVDLIILLEARGNGGVKGICSVQSGLTGVWAEEGS